MEKTKTVKLKDVAKKAGVGMGTASRVLNNHSSVSDEKRKLVLDAMKELGYRPNTIARTLKTSVSGIIGVVLMNITSVFYSQIVRGVEDASSELGYSVVIYNTDQKESKINRSIELLLGKKVDGIIFMGAIVDKKYKKTLQDMNVPVVLISTAILFPESEYPRNLVEIKINNEYETEKIVNHLIDIGHTNILMVSAKFDDYNSGVPRLKAFKDTMKKNNLAIDESMILEGDCTYESGYECMKEYLSENKVSFTAVFAATDDMALGAARCLHENGYKIPDDISIAGFDGLEYTGYFYPSLTTIKQPRYSMGYDGVVLVKKMLQKEKIEDRVIELGCDLLIRESTKELNKGE